MKVYSTSQSSNTEIYISGILDKIQEVRRKKKISGTTIAKQIGFTGSAYYAIEKGETRLTIEMICKIAEFMKEPLSTFLLGSNDDPSFNLKKFQELKSENEKLSSDNDQLSLVNKLLTDKIKLLEHDRS